MLPTSLNEAVQTQPVREPTGGTLHVIEERRTTELGAILAEFDEPERLRRPLTRLDTVIPGKPTPRLSTCLAWVTSRLDASEKRLSAQVVEKRFNSGHLFGDDDDHAFAAARW
jgi:hypothetical protein